MADTGTGQLAGRRIVITGAGSGIGRSTALAFAREGARLALFDRDLEAAKAVADLTGALAMSVDVSQSNAVNQAIDKAAQSMNGIDGVVNAAGVAPMQPLAETTDVLWHRCIEVNLSGTFFVCRAAAPYLRRNPTGTIVNIASGQGLLPGPGSTAYGASKGGVITLTRALAVELAPNVRVNSICPGLVDTPMTRQALPDDAVFTSRGQNYAIKRVAMPEEIASTLLFLTSTQSGYVTGVALAVDGGRTFH